MTELHVVLPDGIDDPRHPSGGNVYDRRVCRGLAALGWSVREHPTAGRWPWADAAARDGLDGVLRGVPPGALVLLAGLLASPAPEVLARHADRLRLAVLVHMPLGGQPAPDGVRDPRRAERAALQAADAVVTTSNWTRQRLHDLYALPSDRVHVAEPGVDPADPAPGTAGGGELLCVATVTRSKGHDVLVAALARLRDLPWRCVCAGSLDVDPGFVDELHGLAEHCGVADRVCFPGPLSGADLGEAYAAADALVLASRSETYAMVVTEALARGLPVVATGVGGVPEALGRCADGAAPGVLVRPGAVAPLTDTLRCWLTDAGWRRRLRSAARRRSRTLPGWRATSLQLSRLLAEVPG